MRRSSGSERYLMRGLLLLVTLSAASAATLRNSNHPLSQRQTLSSCSVDLPCDAGTCVNALLSPCTSDDGACSCIDVSVPGCSASAPCPSESICVTATAGETPSVCVPCAVFNVASQFIPDAYQVNGDNTCSTNSTLVAEPVQQCSSTSECDSGRCLNTALTECSTTDEACACVDADVPTCSGPEQCPENNNCVRLAEDEQVGTSTPSLCVPCPFYNLAAQLLPGAVAVVGESQCAAPSPLPGTVPGALVPCESNGDCSAGTCVNTQLTSCTSLDAACACVSAELPVCSPTSGCDGANVCAGLGLPNTPSLCIPCAYYNVTAQFVPGVVSILGENTCNGSNSTSGSGAGSGSGADNNATATDDGVCVDSKLLSHLPRADLVFKSDRRASVLCDEFGSCATSGHMVVYHNKAMMMASYCRLAGKCTRKVMFVNSPRMKANTRVGTKTQELMFTAFAARYQSRFEEGVLAAVVHAGL